MPLPFGVRVFTETESLALGQRRAFRLHLNRQARIPLTERWLPDLHAADQGIIAMAPPRLRQDLFELAIELERRHSLNVERLGH